MSFEDLPRDWPTRPVTDPAITADLLDLIVTDRDRSEGAIGLLLCGGEGRLTQPVVVSSPPAIVTPADRPKVFDVMCRAMSGGPPDGGPPGLLVAVARPGSAHPTPEDLRWRDAAIRSCDDHGVLLLGVWLMTPTSILPLPPRVPKRQSA
jgi:hypothetical protein